MTHNMAHYSTNGGVDYKAFLDHFRKQAEGTQGPMLVPSVHSGATVRNKRGHVPLILVSLNDNKHKPHPDNLPKLEVVDPNEAERMRAMSDLALEADPSKEDETTVLSHSMTRIGRKRTHNSNSQRKKKKQTAAVNSKIKRARDVFDD